MKIRLLLTFLLIFLFSCSKIVLKNWPVVVEQVPDWTMAGRTANRCHFYPTKFEFPLEPVDHVKSSAAIGKTLIVRQGILFYSAMDGTIYSYNLFEKENLGDLNVDLHSTIAIKDSFLIIARRYGDDTLFKYNLSKGKIIWQTNAGDLDSEPLIEDNAIYTTALYKHIDKYDFSTGDKLWKTDIPDQIHSSPVSNENFIFFGCDDGIVYAVEKKHGKISWKFKTAGAVQTTSTVTDSMLFIGSRDGALYALSTKNGKLNWKFETDGPILTDPGYAKNFVFFGSTDGFFYCLDAGSGRLNWRFQAKSLISTAPLIVENAVFFGSLDHHLYAVDIVTGKLLWKFKAKGRIRTDPICWQNLLIFASENNDIYILQSKN